MSRRVLFIAFFFPPIGGVSVPRTLGHVRHLPAHGWETVVLTPRRSTYHLQDPGLLDDVPRLAGVVRTAIIEPAAIKRALGRLLGRGVSPSSAGGVSGAAPSAGRLERLRRLAFFPDDQVGWLPFAVPAAIREHRRRPYDAILSSSSPVTSHLIAGIVHRALGLPWVAEFRDPWVGNALAHRLPWLHRALARRIERWIVSSADRCVFVTPTLTERYRQRYPALAHRFATVTNAYDLPVAASEPATSGGASDGRTLAYAGTLDRPRELATFLDGLRAYLRDGDAPPVRVEFVGHASDACLALIAGAARELGSEAVAHAGFVPRSEARRRLAASDGALVLLGDGPGMDLFVGGKLYEYIGDDRPVLAMLPAGDARDLLAGLGWGTLAEPTAASVADALRRFASVPHEPRIADPDRRFERRAVVARLAAVLDAAVDVRAAP